MIIVPSKIETLDSFLLNAKQLFKQDVVKALERYDKELYCLIDHKRFVLIRTDERTILSSYGLLKFKRRYYYRILLFIR